MSEKIILLKEAEQATKDREKILKARSKATVIIKDAEARYIKEKTRARSKKAAMERDAVLQSKRFDVLNDFDRFEDIQEAYGFDCFDERERDRLEALWNEREAIRNKTTDGIYSDEVTEALRAARFFLADYREDEVEAAEAIEREFKRQREEADIQAAEWMNRQNAEYDRLRKEGTI